MYLLRDFGFSLRHSALQVAATHAELDWNVAAVILVIDKRCPCLFDDLCHLLERHVRAVRGTHGNMSDRVDIGAILGGKAHDDIKALLAVQDLCHRLSTDGCLYRAIDITREHAIARCQLAVGSDEQIRLPKRTKHAEVSDPRD